jgi:3-hydroxy acid dehydrogenase/malonic semialdehyde reductase
MQGSTQGLWAIITGATSGIGRATAEQLAAAGYSLILTGRRADRLQDLREHFAQNTPKISVKTIVMDITKKAEIDDFAQSEGPTLAKVRVLVNNAGLAKGTDKLQDGRVADWDEMFDTNVKGLLYLTRAVLPYMVKNKNGHIVNLGSVAGHTVYPGGAVYCASKFAVRALSEGLRMDLAGSNVRVTNVEPGMVNTEFSLVRLGEKEKADKVYEGMTPLSAQDIAETILWCLQRPGHVNVQEIVIYPTDQAAVGQVVRRP